MPEIPMQPFPTAKSEIRIIDTRPAQRIAYNMKSLATEGRFHFSAYIQVRTEIEIRRRNVVNQGICYVQEPWESKFTIGLFFLCAGVAAHAAGSGVLSAVSMITG